MHKGESIVGLPPKTIIEKGVSMSFIPEDRLGMGLAPSFSITDNMMLKTYNEGKGPFTPLFRRIFAALVIDPDSRYNNGSTG